MAKTCARCGHDVGRHNPQDPGECFDCSCVAFWVPTTPEATINEVLEFLPPQEVFPDKILQKAFFDGLLEGNVLDRWGKKNLHVSDLRVALDDMDEKACARALWLRLRGAKEKPFTFGEMLRWDHGNRIHQRVVELLRKGLEPLGWRLQAIEERVKLQYGITGTLDLELYSPTNSFWVVDFKTLSKLGFFYLEGPRPGDVLQVQSYVKARNAAGGVLLYIDREGDNGARAYPVPRNDEAVEAAAAYAYKIAWRTDEAPPILPPKLKRNVNKGGDSLSIENRWQCQWCSLYEVSCPGALPKELSGLGIIGYDDKKGGLRVLDRVKRKNDKGEEVEIEVPAIAKQVLLHLLNPEKPLA